MYKLLSISVVLFFSLGASISASADERANRAQACSNARSGLAHDESILACIGSNASVELVTACGNAHSGLAHDESILACISSNASVELVIACGNAQSGLAKDQSILACLGL
ncbi:MAG: hypothetical protein ACXVCE_17250 [Bacteriovorax sp.]